MNGRRILLFGIGGHAMTVADAILARGEDRIAGVVSHDGAAHTLLPGVVVAGSNDDFPGLLARCPADAAVIGLGDPAVRAALAARILPHLPLAAVIHPRAVVSPHAQIGPGAVVFAGAIVNPGARIGANAIVNTAASVDHHTVVGELAHIAPGALLAGHVAIGARAWIGAGAVVVDHRSVGADAFVGAGSVVSKDVPAGARHLGGRILRGLPGGGEPLR